MALPLVPLGQSRDLADPDGDTLPLPVYSNGNAIEGFHPPAGGIGGGSGEAGPSDSEGREWELNVRTLIGQNIAVRFWETPGVTTVLDIKRAIEESQDIPTHLQRLIFGGREIRDDERLSALMLSPGDTVHMLLRQQPAPGADQMEQGIYLPPQQQEGGGQGGPAEGDPGPVGPDGLDRNTRMIQALQMSRAVRIFAVIDCIFLIMSAFSLWPLAVGVLLAILGYQGASQFRRGLILCYLVYLFFAVILRGFWTGLAWSEEMYFVSVIMFLSMLIEAYIFWIVFKFAKLLRYVTERERRELIEIMSAPPM